MPIAKKKAPITEVDTRAWNQVYDDINQIIDSVNTEESSEDRNSATGNSGDVRLVRDTANNKYLIEGKFSDGWAQREMFLSRALSQEPSDEEISGAVFKTQPKQNTSLSTTPADDYTLTTKAYVDSITGENISIATASDTAIANATSGQILIYDGTDTWDNKALSGPVAISSNGVTTVSTLNQSTTGNAATATVWANARTLSLEGDASGDVIINGSQDMTLTVAVDNDSHTHDTRYRTETELAAQSEGTAGAYLIGAYPFEFDNSSSTNVQDVLDDLDAAITSGATNTTYSIQVPTATTKIRLDSANPTGTDDIEIYGGTNVTVTRTNASKLSISSVDTDTTYSAGAGLDLTTTTFSLDLKANSGLQITETELDLNLSASGISGTLAIGDGGTGSTSASTACSALGVGAEDSPTFSNTVLGTFNDNALAHGEIGTANSVTGFGGAGWKIDESSQNYHLMIDDMTIRGKLSVYELLIQQIRATNGAVFVTSSAKVESWDGVNSRITFEDPQGGTLCPFIANDIIMMQKVNPGATVARNAEGGATNVIKKLIYRVDTIDGRAADVVAITGFTNTAAPAAGDDFVRIGNTTDANRKGGIYLTSDDSHAPFIDIFSGVDSVADWNGVGKLKTRLGNLSGITYDGSALSGYGLYGQNVYLTGTMQAADGEWQINNDGSATFADSNLQISKAGDIHITDDDNEGSRALWFWRAGQGIGGGDSTSTDKKAMGIILDSDATPKMVWRRNHYNGSAWEQNDMAELSWDGDLELDGKLYPGGDTDSYVTRTSASLILVDPALDVGSEQAGAIRCGNITSGGYLRHKYYYTDNTSTIHKTASANGTGFSHSYYYIAPISNAINYIADLEANERIDFIGGGTTNATVPVSGQVLWLASALDVTWRIRNTYDQNNQLDTISGMEGLKPVFIPGINAGSDVTLVSSEFVQLIYNGQRGFWVMVNKGT